MIVPELRTGLLYWIVSYPKSGNTWMRFLLRDYFETPHWFSDISIRWAPEYEESGMPLPEDLVAQAMLRPSMALRMRQAADDVPAFVKSHHAAAAVAGQPLFARAWTAGVVVMVRDPRDILPSLAKHMGMTFPEAAALMADDDAVITSPKGLHHLLTSWSGHVASWRGTDRVRTHVVRYEDLQANPAGELAEVIRFLGVRPQMRRVNAVVKANELERIRELEDQDEGFVERGEQDRFFGSSPGRDSVPTDLLRAVEDRHGTVMGAMGYRSWV